MSKAILSPEDIKELYNQAERVRSIDEEIERIQAKYKEDINILSLGRGTRVEVGEVILTKFSNQVLGKIIKNALLTALLQEREKIVSSTERIQFKEPPKVDL